jgi:hypothetical protein
LTPDATGKVNVLTALGFVCGFPVNIRITLKASDLQGNPGFNNVVLRNFSCVN